MITVLGSTGFIGSHIVQQLAVADKPFYAPAKETVLDKKYLGDIIYCIGLTAGFRSQPYKTVEAHICLLKEVLEKCNFNSITYLSSTRVYINNKESVVNESSPVTVNPEQPDDLYNLTKLTGESLCINSGKKAKVARIANVVCSSTGSNSFLASLINEVLTTGKLSLRMNPASAKDYILVNEVASLLIKMAGDEGDGIYNLCSGISTSIHEITAEIKKEIPGFETVNFTGDTVIFPHICNDKIKSKFNYQPESFIKHIPQIIKYQIENV